MDHAVAIRANERQVSDMSLATWLQHLQGLGVMAFDEPIAPVAVLGLEVEAAYLTGQRAALLEYLSLFALDKFSVAVVPQVDQG